MQLVSLDQNNKEYVLNMSFFGIFKVFVMKNALQMHEAMTYKIFCKRNLSYSVRKVKNTK